MLMKAKTQTFQATGRKDKDGRVIYTKGGIEYVKRKVTTHPKSQNVKPVSRFVMEKITKTRQTGGVYEMALLRDYVNAIRESVKDLDATLGPIDRLPAKNGLTAALKSANEAMAPIIKSLTSYVPNDLVKSFDAPLAG